mgnify:FL=1
MEPTIDHYGYAHSDKKENNYEEKSAETYEEVTEAYEAQNKEGYTTTCVTTEGY